MIWIVLLIIIAGFIFLVIGFKSKFELPSSDQPSTNYEKKKYILSPAERSFYGVLKQAVGEEATIFTMVRVADVITPIKGLGRSGRQTALNKISRKHFDFILCKNDNLSVLCCIELNDKTHQEEDRQERDIFLQSVCESIKLPLITINAQSSYNITEIKECLSNHIPEFFSKITPEKLAPANEEKQIVIPTKTETTKPIELIIESKKCPKCSTELVKRVAKNGAHAGKSFWACKAYPKCKHIEQINA